MKLKKFLTLPILFSAAISYYSFPNYSHPCNLLTSDVYAMCIYDKKGYMEAGGFSNSTPVPPSEKPKYYHEISPRDRKESLEKTKSVSVSAFQSMTAGVDYMVAHAEVEATTGKTIGYSITYLEEYTYPQHKITSVDKGSMNNTNEYIYRDWHDITSACCEYHS